MEWFCQRRGTACHHSRPGRLGPRRRTAGATWLSGRGQKDQSLLDPRQGFVRIDPQGHGRRAVCQTRSARSGNGAFPPDGERAPERHTASHRPDTAISGVPSCSSRSSAVRISCCGTLEAASRGQRGSTSSVGADRSALGPSPRSAHRKFPRAPGVVGSLFDAELHSAMASGGLEANSHEYPRASRYGGFRS